MMNNVIERLLTIRKRASSSRDTLALLNLVEALLAERNAWNEYGDKGVGPYVEAADYELERFGEGDK
jgi:hypothetical protein